MYLFIISCNCYIVQEAELGFLQLQSKVNQLKEEKERLLNSLVESELVSHNVIIMFDWLPKVISCNHVDLARCHILNV